MSEFLFASLLLLLVIALTSLYNSYNLSNYSNKESELIDVINTTFENMDLSNIKKSLDEIDKIKSLLEKLMKQHVNQFNTIEHDLDDLKQMLIDNKQESEAEIVILKQKIKDLSDLINKNIIEKKDRL